MFSTKFLYRLVLIFSVVLVPSHWKYEQDDYSTPHEPCLVRLPSAADHVCPSESQSCRNDQLSPTAALGIRQVHNPPSIQLLIELNIVQGVVVDKASCLPIQLLQDDRNVQNLEYSNQLDIEKFYIDVFREWLKGSGYTATWRTLIEVLNRCKLKELANNLLFAVSEDVIDKEPFPFSHSLEIASFVQWLKQKYTLESVVDSPLLRRFGFYESMRFVNLTFKDAANEYKSAHKFSMNWFLYQVNKLQKLMVISGNPGSGKTTLMHYLAKKWAEGRVLRSCQILLLIHLGDCKKEYKSLKDVLKDTEYNGHTNTDQIANLIQDSHGKGACFLLDAYDEKFVKRDFLEKLINLNHLPHSLRIVTSRSAFANNLKLEVHIKVVGFSEKYIDSYVSQLPQVIQNSLLHLWSQHSLIKLTCQSPLYLSLIVYIVASEETLTSGTKTSVYVGVLNSLMAHYQGIHHQWNAGSLRECIMKKPPCSDNMLCCAFRTLQRIAFDMLFSKREYFEMEEFSLHMSIKSLSIVSIHPISHDNVTYSFAHPTFTDFFAALYLTTLPQEKRLFYITKYRDKIFVWQLFFGLMGRFYIKDVDTVSLLLKRYVSHHGFLMKSVCRQYCFTESKVIFTRSRLETILELEWTAEDHKEILISTGIVTNYSMYIFDRYRGEIGFSSLLKNVLEVVAVHKLCYHVAFDFMITIEDWTLKLNKNHLDVLQKLNNNSEFDSAALPKTISITSLGLDYTFPRRRLRVHNFKNFPHLSQLCIRRAHSMNGKDLVSATDLRVLELSARNIDDNMYKALQALSNVNYLDVRGASFNYGAVHSFTSLQTLGFEVTSPVRGIHLSGVLKKPSELRSLTLSRLNCEEIPAILYDLNELKELHIHNSDLNDCTDILVHHLRQQKGLKILEITDFKMKFQKLAKILPQFSSLQVLCLQRIGLTDKDISMLSSALKDIKSLNSLTLESKFITDKSIKTVVDVLKSKSHEDFHSLDLTYDYVGKNIKDFSALAQLSQLRFLAIYPKHYKNKDTIVKVLQSLTQLKDLRWTTMSLQTDEAIDTLIEVMNNLTNIRIQLVETMYT